MKYNQENVCRYLLFGNDDGWVAEQVLFESDESEDCVKWAAAHPQKFMFIIDRHNPHIPLYLDSKNNYVPYENEALLNSLEPHDFPLLNQLITKGLIY